MCHKKHGAVASLLQGVGQPRVTRYARALHGIAEHDGRKGVERGIKAVVGVVAGRIAVGKTQRVAVKRVETGCEAGLAAKATHQFGRHRLHEHHHHIAAHGLAVGLHPPRYGRYALDACASIVLLHQAYGLSIGHEVQGAIFRTQVVERAVEQAEHGVDAHIVEHRAAAKVGGAHLDGIVAQTAANAQEAGAAQGQAHQQFATSGKPPPHTFQATRGGGHDLGPMLERTAAHIPQKDREQGGGHHKQGYVQIV